jgi:Uma2 family endonuclease
MVAVLEKPMHMVLPHITWDTYERILDETGETHLRVNYLRGRIEFITIPFEHERFNEWFARLIFFIALELKIEVCSGGSTTLKSALAEVGLEPDRCFWIKHEAQMRAKEKWQADTDPPPDLAVEIDITSSWLDRLEIYAALKIPEVWRFDGQALKVLILGVNGKYKERAKSLSFPALPMDGFARFVKNLGSIGEVALIKEFIEWLRSSVVGKKNGGERKNGRR